MRLHHVQVACPPGGEDDARRFWAEGLGLAEVEKPAALRARGGAWFRDASSLGSSTQGFRDASSLGFSTRGFRSAGGGAEIHVGVEEPFVSARKAHPALVVGHVAELEAVAARLDGLGFEVDWSQRETFPGHVRFHTFDAHGNRVELLSRA
jgi:catechol 2,3-dioxygenase-like lactoylglutathione lyase family enzyme